MRKFLVLSMALLLTIVLANGVYASQFDVTGFSIGDTGAVLKRATVEVVTTSDTVKAAESGKVFLIESGSGEVARLTLPNAADGLTYTFVSGKAAAFEVDVDSTDTLNLLTLSVGEPARSAGAVGDTLTVWATGDSTWFCNPHGVTFVDING